MTRPHKVFGVGQLATEPVSHSSRLIDLIGSLCEANIHNSRAAALEVVKGWWLALVHDRKSSLELVGYSPDLPSLVPGVAVKARAFGEGLAAMPVPAALEQVGKLYTHALPMAHRSAYGIFYTPPALVNRLLDRATAEKIDWRTARVISPSCGGGAFLVEDALRMAAAMSGSEPAIIVASIGARLVGWDSDPFACWLSQVAVEAALLDYVVPSGRRLGTITECRDSLMDDWTGHAGKYDLVNDNPAFGKVKRSEALAVRFSRSQRGHMNTYSLFTDLAVHLAKDRGGIVAYLTPTSYLSGDYFARLRELLSAVACPSSIDLVESRTDVFPDVLQEVALSVFVKGDYRKRADCCCIHIESSGLRIEGVGELVLPSQPNAPWLIARDPESVAVIEAMQRMATRLSDWGYRVKTGPLVPHKNESRMMATEVMGSVPVVWAESIPATGGRFGLRCGRMGRKAWYKPKDDCDSNVTASPSFLLQRTTSKEQARRLIGAVMSAEAVIGLGGRVAVENHVNMLLPSVQNPDVSLEELARFFASDAADRAFRCISGSVAVSATELESLPLPATLDLKEALSSGEPDAALRRLYGIAHGKNRHAKEVQAAKGGPHGTARTAAANAFDSSGGL